MPANREEKGRSVGPQVGTITPGIGISILSTLADSHGMPKELRNFRSTFVAVS